MGSFAACGWGQTLLGRLCEGQSLQIWTGRWSVKVCKQAKHVQSEKCFPDRSRRLSQRPFRLHGQPLPRWEGEGEGGGMQTGSQPPGSWEGPGQAFMNLTMRSRL